MPKAKVLISYYSGESGFTPHRVYMEPDFDQAQRDLDMIIKIDSLCKDVKLFDCEVYFPLRGNNNEA